MIYRSGDRKSAIACRSSRSRCRRRRAQSSRDRNGRACRDESRRSGGGAPYWSCGQSRPRQPHRARPQTALATALRSIALFERTSCSFIRRRAQCPAFQAAAISLRPARKGSKRWPGVKARRANGAGQPRRLLYGWDKIRGGVPIMAAAPAFNVSDIDRHAPARRAANSHRRVVHARRLARRPRSAIDRACGARHCRRSAHSAALAERGIQRRAWPASPWALSASASWRIGSAARRC